MSIPALLNGNYAEMGRRQRRGTAWHKRNRELKRKVCPDCRKSEVS